MKHALLILILLAPLALAYEAPGFTGCVMLLPDGQFQDSDCDKTPDVLDNCPLVPNDQYDVDRNGLGDACDIVIDGLTLEPGAPMQGRSLLVRAAVFNNRPYPVRNLIAKAEMPRYGEAVSQPLPTIAPGQRIETELLLRVPECAPPVPTDIVAYVEYPFAPGRQEVFSRAVRIPIVQSGTCSLDPGQDLTVVDIIELQDVLPDVGAVYPFTIKNNWPESKAYILSVQGMDAWGTVTIEPGSVVVVPPGETRQGALFVHAYEGQEGQKGFTFTVQARDDAKQTLLTADIKQVKQASGGSGQLLMGVLVFLAILILIALVLAFMSKKDRKHLHRQLEESEEEATETKPRRKK